MKIDVDKIGSAASLLQIGKTVDVIAERVSPRAGDVVAVRALRGIIHRIQMQ